MLKFVCTQPENQSPSSKIAVSVWVVQSWQSQGPVSVGNLPMGNGFMAALSSLMAMCTFGRQRDTRAIPPCPAEEARAALAQHASLTREEVFCRSSTHSTAGSHLPWKKVAGQLEVLHEPALAQQQALGPPLSQQAIYSHVEERAVILSPSYLRIRSRRWSFIHTRSSLVPRFLTSRLSSHFFLNVLLNRSFRGLLLIFYYSTNLKV